MNSTQEQWLVKLRKLNPSVSHAKGEGNARFAPHKPLLLLCLIEMAESGALIAPVVEKSAELRLRFDCYWGNGVSVHYLSFFLNQLMASSLWMELMKKGQSHILTYFKLREPPSDGTSVVRHLKTLHSDSTN